METSMSSLHSTALAAQLGPVKLMVHAATVQHLIKTGKKSHLLTYVSISFKNDFTFLYALPRPWLHFYILTL